MSNREGRPKKILTKEDIKLAMSRTRSNMAAARSLHVSFPHYKKYAKLYKDENSGSTLFDLHSNQSGSGIPKIFTEHISKKRFKQILNGEAPIYSWNPETLKKYVIHFGVLEEKCGKCGFCERRVLDLKPPLLLNFKDGNKHNWHLKNLEFLCYNCYFLYVTNILSKKQIISLEDYNTGKQVEDFTWEIDAQTLEYFQELGLAAPTIPSGSEFIDYL